MKKLLLLLVLSSCTKYTIIIVQPSLNEAVVKDTVDISGWKYYPNTLPEYNFITPQPFLHSPRFLFPNDYPSVIPDSIKIGYQLLRISGCTDSILIDSTFKINKL